MRVLPCGMRALLVELDDAAQVAGLYATLRTDRPDGVVDLVPGARTLLVQIDPARTDLARVRARLAQVPVRPLAPAAGPLVRIPVAYQGEDLAEVARLTGLAPDEVVRRHAGGEYRVAFCGFAPGFAYLTGLDPSLHVPRRATPRTRVPAGSVAVAGEYAAVYPGASPGGWRLLGRTDVRLWDLDRSPPALLTPGTRVRFVPAR